MLRWAVVRKYILLFFLLIASPAFGHSLQLGGTNGMVEYPYNTAWDDLPLDIDMQFRMDVLPITKGEKETLFILERNSGADYIWDLFVSDADNKLHFTTNSGSGVDIESDSALEAGKKYSVIITIDASLNVKMYIDDQVRDPDTVAADLLQADQAMSSSLTTTSPGNLYAGCKSDGSECLDGTLFETIGWNANPATFPVITVFDGLKFETSIINHWPYFDGQGSTIWSRYQYPSTGYDNGTVSGDYSWNIDSYNWVIEEEYNKYYFPGNLTGTMDINSGISRETELYGPDDYSWADMRKVTQCTLTKSDNLPEWYERPDTCENKCDREFYVMKTGNDTTGDGSFGNPWKTISKAVGEDSNRVRYRDCYYIGTGDYYEVPGLHYNPTNIAVVPMGPKNRVWVGSLGDGPVRIHNDHTPDMVWTNYSGNIQRANYQTDSGKLYLRVSNLILDDNFPDCCEKMQDIDDLAKDGDWFVDEKTSTVTSTSASKLIDSTANFGSETLPTEVGMSVINVNSGQTATISAIDSTTQLSLSGNIFSTVGNTYRVQGDMYVYLDHGTDPYADRQGIVTGKAENIEYGFNHTGFDYVTFYGLEMVGTQSYAFNGFTTAPASYIDIVRDTIKYTKGLAFAWKGWRIIQSRGHGNINSAVGNGIYYGTGSFGGWPSDFNSGTNSVQYGNIVSWTGGECIGGAESDNKIVEWNIASNCWSVAFYPMDSSKNPTVKNNVGMVHKFMPHYVSKYPDNEIARVWNRMVSQGILLGDETKPYTQQVDISNNVMLGTQRVIDMFSSCGVSTCQGKQYPDEPSASGWKYVTVANNVYVAPNWLGRAAGFEWIGFLVNHQSGPINDASVGSMFINNFQYFPNGGYNFWWYSDTGTPEPNVHLVDNNYYLSKFPHPFQWRAVKYDFDDFKTQSNYDTNSQFDQPQADGTVSTNLMTRTNWNLEGEQTFKFSDFYPVSGSVLINAGNTFDLTGTWSYHDFQWDIRGNRRPIGSPVDIGLFSTEPWLRKSIGNGTISGGAF